MSEINSSPFKFLPSLIETHHEDPFRDDALDRRPLAENLTKLVASFASQPFVLGINGTWGAGKSKFLEMWGAYLRSNGYRTLYFNAWENDHADDPFAAVLSEFRKLTEVESAAEKSQMQIVWDKLAKKSLPILERVAVSAVKNLTLGALDLKSAETESLISDLAQETAKYALKRCEDNRKSIEAFRAELKDFVQRVDDPNKPIVYMVDELDRCRPTFAVAVLERIKHLLNVPGVTFVFAWDRHQLNGTIRSIYGEQTDPNGYLLRFIDLEMNLPQGDSIAFCKALMKRFGLWDYLYKRHMDDYADRFIQIFPEYAIKFKLTIREQEKVFTAMSIVWRTVNTQDGIVIELLLLLIMLRLKHSDVYGLIGNELFYEKLIVDDLPKILGEEYWSSDIGNIMQGCFLYALPSSSLLRKSKVEELSSMVNTQARSNCSHIFDGYCWAQNYERNKGGVVKDLIKKIEFSGNFMK